MRFTYGLRGHSVSMENSTCTKQNWLLTQLGYFKDPGSPQIPEALSFVDARHNTSMGPP